MTEVAVAVVGAIATVAVALIARMSSRLGAPNGKGNVVEMLEALLAGQTGQDARLAKLETGQLMHAHRLQRIEHHVGMDEGAA